MVAIVGGGHLWLRSYPVIFSKPLWKFSFVVTVLKYKSYLELMYTHFESAYSIQSAINFRIHIEKRGSLALAMHLRDVEIYVYIIVCTYF